MNQIKSIHSFSAAFPGLWSSLLEMPRSFSPQPPPPANPGRHRTSPKPADRFNLSSKPWIFQELPPVGRAPNTSPKRHMGGILVRYIKTPSNTDNQGWKGRYSTGFWKMLLEGWWKKNCGRKRCSLERTVKKNQLKNLGRLHKERTEAGISASAMKTSPCTDVFRKRAAAFTFLISGQSRSRDYVRRIIPDSSDGLGRKSTAVLLSGPKSSF